jgi:transcriptional regulator with XRE-family HTH domain
MITGKQLREIREYRELSLRDLAKFCDVSPQLIGQIEQGKRSFTENTYGQIIKALNVAFAEKQAGRLIKKNQKNENLRRN